MASPRNTPPRARRATPSVFAPATERTPMCAAWAQISPQARTHIEQAQKAIMDPLHSDIMFGVSDILEHFLDIKGIRWWQYSQWKPLRTSTLPDTVTVGKVSLTRAQIGSVMNSTQHTVLDVAPGILTCMVWRLPEMVREWSAEQRAVVDLMAVSGFVHILANPLKAPQRVFCVCSPARTHVRSPMALMRIWHHALTLMQRAGVTHAVLSASHQDESLQELFRLLSTNGYGMTAVFVCASDPVYTASCESLRRIWAEQLTTCVIVMRHSLPISWAAHLAKRSMQTGMMIMTHPFFVRHRLHPVIDWNRDTQPQIPPEFLQTTLLLHHQAVKAVAVELIPDVPQIFSDIPQIDTFSPCTNVDHLPGDCHRGCHVTGCTDYCISWGMTKLDSWQRDQLYDVLNLSGSQMDLKAQYHAGLGAMKTLMGAVVQLPSEIPSTQSHFPRKVSGRSPSPEYRVVCTYQEDYETTVAVKDPSVRNTHPRQWPDAQHRFSSLCALSGWLTLAPAWEQKVFCVSAVGINYEQPANRSVFDDYAPAIHRMRRLWHHILTLFHEAEVPFVALNAIGCGQFAYASNNREHIPRWYAEALCDVLETKQFAGLKLKAIFVVLHDHYAVFQQVITQRHRERKPNVTVCLTRIHSMFDIAKRLPSGRLGILNSSNEQFVRRGEIPWLNAEQVNVQMVLAVQTTLLFQLREVNPGWSEAIQARRGPGAWLFDVNESVHLSGGWMTRHFGELFVVVWTWRGPNDAVMQCVSRVLRKASNTLLPMREVWKRDRKPMTRFMQLFFEVDTEQTSQLSTELESTTGGFMVKDNENYTFGENVSINGNDLIATQLKMKVSFLDDQVHRVTPLQTLVNNRLRPPPLVAAPILDDTDDTLCAVTGEVYLLMDPLTGTGLTDPPKMVCVSIPGIDFNRSGHRKKFSGADEWRPNVAAQLRMAQIWHHTLSLFQQWGVTHPVLCAIGCGAFVPEWMSRQEITEAYARALVDALAHTDYGFEAVFLSLPDSNRFSNFDNVIEKRGRLLRTPVQTGF